VTQQVPLFGPRHHLRNLVVLADAALLHEEEPNAWTPKSVLASLLDHQPVDGFRYAEAGPPGDADRLRRPRGVGAVGWVTLAQASAEAGGVQPFNYADKTTLHRSAIDTGAVRFAAEDVGSDSYRGLDLDAARQAREEDMRAAQVAQAMGANISITARRYVFESSALRQSPVCFVGVEEALALIGLYLRSQGEFVVLGGRDRIELGRRHFYWVGARELLPEAWRWLAACTQRSHAAGDERPLYLGVSLLQRVERSLWARDDLHRASQRPQTGETSDLVLKALDRILLFLMGAVDAAARVAHIVLNLKGELRFAGWRQQEWYRALLKSDPALAAVVAPGSAHERALLILSRLRNSVHGEALAAVHVSLESQPARTLVGLPRVDVDELLGAMDALGGRHAWGAEEILPNEVLVDAPQFIAMLLPRIVAMLNDVMRLTPVETLPGVTLTETDARPPVSRPVVDPFSEECRLSVRWQLGL